MAVTHKAWVTLGVFAAADTWAFAPRPFALLWSLTGEGTCEWQPGEF